MKKTWKWTVDDTKRERKPLTISTTNFQEIIPENKNEAGYSTYCVYANLNATRNTEASSMKKTWKWTFDGNNSAHRQLTICICSTYPVTIRINTRAAGYSAQCMQDDLNVGRITYVQSIFEDGVDKEVDG